jgi:hypothetical protein
MFGQNGYQSLDPAATAPSRKKRILAAAAALSGVIALGSLWHTGPKMYAAPHSPS